ncbi:hypothetical protein BH11PSE14_BH11PSE14_14050 [soil metagenome]
MVTALPITVRSGSEGQMMLIRIRGLLRVVMGPRVLVMRQGTRTLDSGLWGIQATCDRSPTGNGDGQAKQQDQEGAEGGHAAASLPQCRGRGK